MAKFPLENILEGVKHIWTKSQGPDAEGAAVTANPLTVGYKDAEGKATGVTPTNMLPVGDATAQGKLADILTKLSADPATQTTLAQILAKIIAAPATEAKQDTIIGHVDGVEGTLTALNGKDFATQATLAAILNKIIAAPATEAKQTALNALIGEVQAAPTANTLLARLKSLEDKIAAIIAGTSPAVVQLSGSIVSLGTLSDVTVTPGSTVDLLSVSSQPNYTKLSVAVYMAAATYTYKIDVEYKVAAHPSFPIVDPVYTSGSLRFNIFTCEVKALTYRVFLTNLGTGALVFGKAEVCGIKEAK